LNFISHRITELRLSKNISSRKLSLDLGLSNSYITQIENGKKMPSLENLYRICDYFDITIADFFAPVGTSKFLTDDLRELIHAAKDLTPEQIKAFTEAFKTITKG